MKKILLILLTLALTFGIIGTAGAVPMTWTDNGHEYEFVALSSFTSWNSARSAAMGLGTGWDLATITSVAEMNFITGSVISPVPGTNDYATYWIGGYQTFNADPAAGWVWVSGEPFAGDLWNGGQPDDFAEDQKFLMLFHDPRASGWGLDDNTTYDGGIFKGFIAERAAVPESATMILLGFGLISLAGFGRKKFLKK